MFLAAAANGRPRRDRREQDVGELEQPAERGTQQLADQGGVAVVVECGSLRSVEAPADVLAVLVAAGREQAGPAVHGKRLGALDRPECGQDLRRFGQPSLHDARPEVFEQTKRALESGANVVSQSDRDEVVAHRHSKAVDASSRLEW